MLSSDVCIHCYLHCHKMIIGNILETTEASNFKIKHIIPIDCVYIFTVNDVIFCFRQAANPIYMFIFYTDGVVISRQRFNRCWKILQFWKMRLKGFISSCVAYQTRHQYCFIPKITTEEYGFWYSGDDMRHQHGVGFILSKNRISSVSHQLHKCF